VLEVHINNAQIQKVLELHLHKVYSTQTKTGISASRKADELVLSSKATELQQVKQTVTEMPDTRASLVQSLKQKVQSGTYCIDEQSIADSMLDTITECRNI